LNSLNYGPAKFALFGIDYVEIRGWLFLLK